MENKALLLVEELALKKHKIFYKSPLRYLLRSMLASMFIGFGVIVAFKAGNFFYIEHSPFAYPVAALTFGAAIILIAYGGGDLFTGNTFYFSYTAFQKKMRWVAVIKLWITSYIGNILGACFFAFFIFSTGLFSEKETTGFLLSVADKKVHLPTYELFFRGILCNWLVCLAFFIPMKLQGDGAKLFTMMLFVFCFFISGYEHSIANMCTFAIAFVSHPPESFTLAGVIHNLIPVTIGNLIGGGVLMGWMYYFVNKPFMVEENEG
ncbi:formate/nitrite transporter family protein [Metabacillus litoralis]|uniref:formate/nitrite transporter family protein n=1 Tax=Metabacillus litoralis TaxID=152268 RepID=UPI000EF5D645|nr:formate/nitrite transporter family protein [Metabacillus litoralis]MCM3160049.1 formate/nitrite transporter family protein [Metabacillus litoralis]UHA59705.1 formate/nitrite transporter family protein [Metabacillus litoralis]